MIWQGFENVMKTVAGSEGMPIIGVKLLYV
jgi:hypothetical protein